MKIILGFFTICALIVIISCNDNKTKGPKVTDKVMEKEIHRDEWTNDFFC